ncbi:lysine--tRNA ligase [Candidatus Sumerlaeota bacterium]|nr:lysine--tRNA ligase [Candidatus Sumerlaeota bacterium]
MTTPEFPFLPDHNDLIANRYQKAEALRAAGTNPYPADFPVDHLAADVLARKEELIASGEQVSVLGRAFTIRAFGKAAFFHLRDRSGQIQVYLKQGVLSEADFKLYKEFLDAGDIVGVKGRLFTTKTGETTIEASAFTICTKSVRQLPEKWQGLTDVEIRYRQRYLDMIANPEVTDVFRSRSRVVSAMRRFLDDSGFIEVETPMMQPLYGGASARPFTTHHNALDMPLYLRIAPELYLKRLVVGGLHRVYEINRNFRNEGLSTRHNPEFTMLELYAAGWNARDMMRFVEDIVRESARGGMQRTEFTITDQQVDFAKPFTRVKMTEVVRNVLAVDVDWDTPFDEARRRVTTAIPADIRTTDALIVFLFEQHCEATLIQPTFIIEFPKSVSPLAKSIEGRAEVADRFELYANGVEIANGYSELNDPREQYQRFQEQLRRREGGDLEAVGQIDEDYVRALEYGMPPTAGLGIGIDRLVMLMTGAQSIRDVILFPLMRPVAEHPPAADDKTP